MSLLLLGAGDTVASDHADVTFVQHRALTIEAVGTTTALAAGDTMNVPPHLPHRYTSEGGAFIVRAA